MKPRFPVLFLVGFLLVILFASSSTLPAAGAEGQALAGEPPFDQPIVDFLAGRDYPVVDMRDAFADDYAHSKLDIQAYLERYYIGHHTPAGNFFTANALLEPMLEWVDPKPAPYAGT